ncbi:ATP-binding cassette domain-containing protein [Emticicia sp. CRIBPO]|uniref:ABC transporter ATP-binding protein n=1 Tax=Emticicia sp. CRIBPO TaxID=2683258 RepID=UPI0014136EF0|nr:ABC transporter ATP-binding protein [Emticicia sp. CRIBPO]NBA85894.1 ATP-binding cassette domain-containing protein [Emticicia sp. CRIBPO]
MQEEKYSGKIVDSVILKRLYKFIKPYEFRFYLLVLTILVGAVTSPLLPLLIQYAIDGPVSEGDYQGLSMALLAMVLLLVFSSVVAFFNTYLAGWLSQHVIRDIRVQVYEKIVKLKLKFFDDTPIGRLVTRTISDVETLSDVFSSGFAAIAGDILQLILIIAVMFYTDWRLSLISLATVPLLLISTYVFKEKIKKSFNLVRNAVANLNTFVQEHLTGMSLVQIFNSEKTEFDKFEKINAKHRDENIRSILYYSVYYPVADVISALGTGLVVWYGAKEILNEQASYGTITAFIMFINQFFRPIRMIADRVNTLQMGVVSTSRILDILDSSDNKMEGGEVTRHIEGKVNFENVWFAYNNDNYVLKGITFEAKEGETIAFVGATGAGKSSIINLLPRFYDISKGEVLIDGVPVKEYNLQVLRKQIGMVLQDVFLFSDSIEYNITLGDESISREQVVEAAKLVGVHDFIMQLPGDYDYKVMERGATLSVGQRQLISFVRALVQNPKIMILDEATSSIDSESEEMIQNAIDKLMKGRTAIVIAHRLSTIQKADKIIVIDKGHIVEQGSHEDLLTIENGFYNNLYQIQYASALV